MLLSFIARERPNGYDINSNIIFRILYLAYLLKPNHVCAGFEKRYSDYFGERRYKIDRIPQIFIIQFSIFISGFAGLGYSTLGR